MAKARSPQYPAIGLKEAIDKVRLIYEEDYQNKLPKLVIAEHMGYKSLNGKSLGVISALSKYGLLEGRGDETHVSDLALSIIAHDVGDSERTEAIRLAASKPNLFSGLDSKFLGGKASDQAIRSYLLTEKFIPEAADNAIRSYRETKQLVEAESSGYDSDVETSELADQHDMAVETVPSQEPAARSHARATVEREFLRSPLSPECSVRLLVKGPIAKKELRKLRQLIYFMELWHDLDENERDEIKQEMLTKLDEASVPDKEPSGN